jgi:peroxiredoxin family protein
MNNIDPLILIRAAMIMLNTYYDLGGWAQLIEKATMIAGKEQVQDLIYELTEAAQDSRQEIIECKAEMDLSLMRDMRELKEIN